MGLRKVPAAGSDNAVGSAEREEREVTVRESRSPITRKLSVPEPGRRRSARAPASYFGAFLPEMGEKASLVPEATSPGLEMPLVPAWVLRYPAWRCCRACAGLWYQDTAGNGDTAAKAGLTPAGPFLGGICALSLPLCNAAGSGAALLSLARPAAPKNLLLEPKAPVKAQGEQPQVTVPSCRPSQHAEPGQGWHCPSKATLNLQTFTSSAPTCFTAQSQAPPKRLSLP